MQPLLLRLWGCGWVPGSSLASVAHSRSHCCGTDHDPGRTGEVNLVGAQRLWPAGMGRTCDALPVAWPGRGH